LQLTFALHVFGDLSREVTEVLIAEVERSRINHGDRTLFWVLAWQDHDDLLTFTKDIHEHSVRERALVRLWHDCSSKATRAYGIVGTVWIAPVLISHDATFDLQGRAEGEHTGPARSNALR
jgi:hypothetical protein